MESTFVANVGRDFNPDPRVEVRSSLGDQLERTVLESLVHSFGLDGLVRDQHGGDVDTIHSVRQVGKDSEMTYKSDAHRQAYDARGQYDSSAYHSDAGYIERNREISEAKKAGKLIDAYTGEKVPRNDKIDLDHVVSAKEIHDDPGRVLAGLRGEDLANSPENLQPTNRHTNRSKKAESMDDFLARRGDEYTDKQKALMRNRDVTARKCYESRLAYTYYRSPDFWTHTVAAAGSVGIQMGLRQATGLVLTEIWFAVREKLSVTGRSLKTMLHDIADGVSLGICRAKEKYAQILSRFGEGVVSGVLSSLTTTLCNIFTTTAKNMVRVLRQSFASVVQAGKVLLFNPDNLLFGDRLLTALKILVAGASVVVGILLSEAVAASGLAAVPGVGELLVTFTGVFASGVLSCTLLYALDSCDKVKKAVASLNKFHTIETDIAFYRGQAEKFEEQVAKQLGYNLADFKKETESYANAAHRLMQVENDPIALNAVLRDIINEKGIALPYEGDFNSFMSCKTNALHFS